MNVIWVIWSLSLSLVVILLVIAVFVLARQVGLLHRRLGPAGARMENAGPEVGEPAPEIRALDLRKQEVTLGSNRGKETLLVFVSATCSTCEVLAPALRSIWKSERNHLEVLLVSLAGDEVTNRKFVVRQKLEEIAYVISQELGSQYGVIAPPYGILIDKQGVVRAKGVVNHLEHLESLFNVTHVGYSTMEKWAQSEGIDKMPLASEPVSR
jgi:methylamine dehydrogenase accessory protein MauD